MANPIKDALNARSKRKFDEFWFALQTVGDALMDAEQLAAKLRDHRPTNQGPGGRGGRTNTGRTTGGGRGGGGNRASNGVNGRIPWSAATPEELRAAAKKAHDSLRVMSTTAKRWEAEITSREWR